ncbi:MAG TPA: TetR/AcrR family transcriptional regulator [Methylophilaceae bacterium]|nr:TetR/AcrR family transcriptional regulator [Methylophilaceae bacterium]
MTAKAAAKTEAKTLGRPRAFNEDEALDRALNLFWEKGYEGTSLADLTSSLGINKPSLYAAFGNKEALFYKALQRYASGPAAYTMQALNEPTARQVVEKLLRASAELLTHADNPQSCLIVSGALAGSTASHPVRDKLAEYRNAYLEALSQRFRRAQAEGDLPPDCDAAMLARYVATVHQGMSVQASSGATRLQLHEVVDFVLRQWPR